MESFVRSIFLSLFWCLIALPPIWLRSHFPPACLLGLFPNSAAALRGQARPTCLPACLHSTQTIERRPILCCYRSDGSLARTLFLARQTRSAAIVFPPTLPEGPWYIPDATPQSPSTQVRVKADELMAKTGRTGGTQPSTIWSSSSRRT